MWEKIIWALTTRYMVTWSEVRIYDTIKMCWYTPSYTKVYTTVTNKYPQRRTYVRYHDPGEEEKYIAKSEGGPF